MKIWILLITTLLFLSSCSKQKTKPLHALVLSDNGINTLNASTPYQENIIAPKLQGYDIELFSAFEAGELQSIMRITHYEEEVMLLFPTKSKKEQEATLQSISITSDLVEHPFGIQIGQNYHSKLDLACTKSQGKMECEPNSFEHIYLIFFPIDTKQWQLREIVWSKDALQ